MRNVWGQPVDQPLDTCGLTRSLPTYTSRLLTSLLINTMVYPRLYRPGPTTLSTTIYDISSLLFRQLPAVSTAPTSTTANFNLFYV
jgi:hypothetical protein